MLIKGKRYGTKNSVPYLMNADNSINIDTKIDLIIAKELLRKKK